MNRWKSAQSRLKMKKQEKQADGTGGNSDEDERGLETDQDKREDGRAPATGAGGGNPEDDTKKGKPHHQKKHHKHRQDPNDAKNPHRDRDSADDKARASGPGAQNKVEPAKERPAEVKGPPRRTLEDPNALKQPLFYDAMAHHPSMDGKLIVFNPHPPLEDPFQVVGHHEEPEPEPEPEPESEPEPDPKQKKHHRKHRPRPKADSVASETIFERIEQKRKPRLEQLLHMLNSLEKPPETNQVLSNLVQHGIPEQKALLDFCLLTDSRRHGFGGFVKLMLSPVLRSIVPINCSNLYLPVYETCPSLQAVRYKGSMLLWIGQLKRLFISKVEGSGFASSKMWKETDLVLRQRFVKGQCNNIVCEESKWPMSSFRQTKIHYPPKRQELMDEVQSEALNEEHVIFLRNLAAQQMSSLPLTIMHEILHEQIQVVQKYCESYTKKIGSTHPSTLVAVSHYNLMKKHLETFQFMGLSPMPPLCVTRKYEEPPRQEKQFVTSSSSSEDLTELEAFMQQQGEGKKTKEEIEATRTDLEDELILRLDTQNEMRGKRKGTAGGLGLGPLGEIFQ